MDAAVDWKQPALTPAELLAGVEATAERVTTEYEDGEIVWHCWGEGRPLVLLHGGFGSWNHWVRNVDALSRHYRVLVPDMPGYGNSGDAPDPPHGIADALSRGLQELACGQPVNVTGFSFGSIVGGLIAQRARGLVDGLVIVGAGGLALRRKPLTMAKWRGVTDENERREAHRQNLGILMIANPRRIDALALEMQDRNTSRARINSRPFSRMPLLREAIAATDVLVGGIWGVHDVTAEPYLDERRALLQQLRPGSPFEVIDDAGHWVQYEAPEQFNATLLRVLSILHSNSRSAARG